MRTTTMRSLNSLFLCVLACCAGCRGQIQDLTRAEKWQKDITALDHEFPRRQIDAYGRVTRPEWEQGITELRRLPVPALTDAEIAVHIEKLLARYHDGHITILTDHSIAEPLVLPVRFRWFPNGIYLASAVDSRFLGAKLLQLGNVEADALLTRIAPWVSVENESGLHAAATQALSNTALLADAGIAPAGKPVPVLLQLTSGQKIPLQIEPQPYVSLIWYKPANLPSYRQDHTPPNYLALVPGSHSAYVRYAKCNDEPGNRKIADDLERGLTIEPTLRVIIDLRGNGGGASPAFKPILNVIRQHHIGDAQRLFALTDRGTFSSAFLNTMELKQIGARVVGEASSQRPIYTEEVRAFMLPESHLLIRYTTKWSRHGRPESMELTPDVLVQPTPEQYTAGEDPVLDRVTVERQCVRAARARAAGRTCMFTQGEQNKVITSDKDNSVYLACRRSLEVSGSRSLELSGSKDGVDEDERARGQAC